VTPSTAARLAWGVLGLTVALLAASLALGLTGGEGLAPAGFVPATLAFGVVGALIAVRTPNRVGWLFLAVAATAAVSVVAKSYAARAPAATLPAAPWAGWTLTVVLGIGGPLFFLTPLLFPDGRLPSRRWWPVVWVAAVAGLIQIACAAISDVNFSSNFPHLRDPVTLVPARDLAGLFDIATGLGSVVFLAGAAAVAVRLRRCQGEERLQLKWFAYAAAVAAVTVAVDSQFTNPLAAFEIVVPLIPAAAGVAILKYRLYDIDVVINKTVVYAALAGFITAVYVLVVVGIGALAGSQGRPGLGLPILATAVIAVAFQPVRERVQRFANRLVYGKRATPYGALSELSERMGSAPATEDLLPRMARILAEATGAARTDVWLRSGDALRAVACWPPDAGPRAAIQLDGDDVPAPGGSDRVVAVRHHGELLGALSVVKKRGEAFTPTEDKLIAHLASQAGLVLRNVRLAEQLMARLEELRASGQRLVSAEDRERRRLERDIHDGAQKRLEDLAAKLRQARQNLDYDQPRAKQLLSEVRSEISGTVANLRDLARGIYPPLLADLGLAAALEAQARKEPVPVVVEADGIGRYSRDAEAAVYFCVLEALRNVAKYGRASQAVVRLCGPGLQFSVTDDGAGFDAHPTGYGIGLQAMADRLSAVGGGLEVRSEPGRGTTVTGRLPTHALGPAP